MNIKRMIEVGFLALFALGVGGALWVHQSYDKWLGELVQASGKKVGVGRLELNDLRWFATEQKLSLASAQWFDAENTRSPWLAIASGQWQLPPNAWQGAVLTIERFTLRDAVVHIQQEGLSTNINRLIKQVEAVTILPEKQAKGRESLLFKVNSCALINVHVTLSTLKHGDVTWNIPELILWGAYTTTGSPFDELLQQFTIRLLFALRKQATQHLIVLAESASSPATTQTSPATVELGK
jgi:hypothetical protein